MNDAKPPLSIQREDEVYVRADGSTFTRADIFVKLSITFQDEMLRKLKGPKLSVYLCIALHCSGPEMTSWPSINRIAERTGYSRRAVITAAQKLQTMGLIIIEHRESEKTGYDNNVYQIRGYATMGKGTPSELDAPGASEPGAPGLVNQVHQASEPGTPEEETRKEETRKEEKSVAADAPFSVPAPDDDLNPDKLFPERGSDHNGNVDEKHRRPSVLNDPRAADPIGLGQACAERQEEEAAKGRPPGWTVPGGAEPIPDAMVTAWVTAKGLVPEQIPKKLLDQYRRAMASAVKGLSATEEQAAQAVRRVLTHPDYSWYTHSHPGVEKFKRDVQGVLLQILSGRLQPTKGGQLIETISDEILAQGRGYAAIMAHQRLKEKAARERGEQVPESMWPSIRELEAREREAQEEGQ